MSLFEFNNLLTNAAIFKKNGTDLTNSMPFGIVPIFDYDARMRISNIKMLNMRHVKIVSSQIDEF